jgi:hypothetical protein
LRWQRGLEINNVFRQNKTMFLWLIKNIKNNIKPAKETQQRLVGIA